MHIGVSPMTVSRVLSGDANVKSETVQRVQAAIKLLGYTPNVAARNLARAAPTHIGLLYTNPSAAYLGELLAGVLEESTHAGCQLVLEKTGGRAERAGVERLVKGGVGGVVLMSESKSLLQALRTAKIPCAVVAMGRPGMAGISVRINDFEAAAAMTRYLISIGHRQIGFIAGPPSHLSSSQRQEGFTAAMREAGVPVRPAWLAHGAFSYRSGLVAAEQILNTSQRPTAIFASNDDMAAATIAVANRLRIDVPNGLSVVGFDDTELATTIWPSLTTVRQPIAAMARKAVELLLEEIRLRRLGQTQGSVQHVMNYSLVERESSAAIPP